MSKDEINELKIGDIINDSNYFFYDVMSVYHTRTGVTKVIVKDQWKSDIGVIFTQTKVFTAEQLLHDDYSILVREV